MQASMRSQRTSLVPLFVLADRVTQVVEDILKACNAVVIGEKQRLKLSVRLTQLPLQAVIRIHG